MIRKAERADLRECAEVVRNSFRTVADEFGFTEENAPRFTAFAVTEGRLLWHMETEHRLMYLEEGDGRIRGFYSLLLSGNGECELGNLSVLPAYRHAGIGSSLLRHAVSIAREQHCSAMNLGIVEENTVLRKWYERSGAVHTGTKKFDFFPFTCGYMKIFPEGQPTAAQAAELFAARSAEIFGENLSGVYLHGSAAMGCMNPAKSDLDLITVVEHPPDDAGKRAYMEMVTGLNALFHGKDARHSGIEMSVVRRDVCKPFIYPTPFELHFSAGHLEWYRRDPEDYIRKMKGTDKDLAAHFTILRSRGKCLSGLPVGEVFGEVPEADYLDSILEDIAGAREEIGGNTMYVTLNLARVLAFVTEKAVLSKKEGGEWGLLHLPEEYHPLLRAVLEDYTSGAELRYDREAAEAYADYMVRRIQNGIKP